MKIMYSVQNLNTYLTKFSAVLSVGICLDGKLYRLLSFMIIGLSVSRGVSVFPVREIKFKCMHTFLSTSLRSGGGGWAATQVNIVSYIIANAARRENIHCNYLLQS